MGAAVDAPDDVGGIRIGGHDGFPIRAGLARARYDAEPGTAYLCTGQMAMSPARFRHPTRRRARRGVGACCRPHLRLRLSMALLTSSNFANRMTPFGRLVEAHRGLSDEQSADLDAALVLILANHVGDLDVLREAIVLAKRRMVDASQQQQISSNKISQDVAKESELMAKGFASTSDMAEKKITFSEIGTRSLCLHRRGRSNSAVIVGDDGCIVFDAQATPAMANK